ncbi:MAG: DUF4252 domain-containing protein [Lentimicrobiaceae bacterium]
MKTLFLSCMMGLFLTLSACSQNKSFERFFDQYADKDGFLTVKLSNLPVEMFNSGENDPDLRISSLRVLTVQDTLLNAKLNFYNEIVPKINRSGYEELMTVKHKGQKAILLCKKDRKRITEVLFVSGGDKNVLVEITGSMSLEQAKKMTSQVADDKDEDN